MDSAVDTTMALPSLRQRGVLQWSASAAKPSKPPPPASGDELAWQQMLFATDALAHPGKGRGCRLLHECQANGRSLVGGSAWIYHSTACQRDGAR